MRTTMKKTLAMVATVSAMAFMGGAAVGATYAGQDETEQPVTEVTEGAVFLDECEHEDGSGDTVCVWRDGTGDTILNTPSGWHNLDTGVWKAPGNTCTTDAECEQMHPEVEGYGVAGGEE